MPSPLIHAVFPFPLKRNPNPQSTGVSPYESRRRDGPPRPFRLAGGSRGGDKASAIFGRGGKRPGVGAGGQAAQVGRGEGGDEADGERDGGADDRVEAMPGRRRRPSR